VCRLVPPTKRPATRSAPSPVNLELVDCFDHAISDGKRGRIPDNLPPILDQLKIDPLNYIRFINRTQKHRFQSVIGAVDTMRALASEFGRTFLKGQNAAAALFSPD